ncbi:hypothetical protein Tco_0535050 [Tanacetum coccineum]
MDASPYLGSPLQLKLYGNGNIGHDASKGTRYHLFEKHKAHVRKFVATEDQLNKAVEARSTCQKLLKRLLGSSGISFFGGTLQNSRQLQLAFHPLKMYNHIINTRMDANGGLDANAKILSRIIETTNAKFLENGEVSGSDENQVVDINKIMDDDLSPKNVPKSTATLDDVPIFQNQEQHLNNKQTPHEENNL